MENKVIHLTQAPSFRSPSEEDVRVAVHAAVEKAGPDLFKTFFNDHKDSVESLTKAA